MFFALTSPYMRNGFRLSLSELRQRFFGMHVIPVDPLVVRRGVAFPLDQVLDFAPSAMLS